MYTLNEWLLILDDPDVYHRGPVAVQVVGRRLREEQVLEISDAIAAALHIDGSV